jgi:hypothetical protein
LKKFKDIKDTSGRAMDGQQFMFDAKARYRNSSNTAAVRSQVHEQTVSDLSRSSAMLDRVAALRSSHNHSAFAYGKI